MKDFFKYVFATVVGIVISTVVLFILFIIILVGAITSFSDDKKIDVKSNSVLYIDLDQPITERTPENSLSGLPIFGNGEGKTIGFNDLIKALNAAKTDDKIKCVYINVSAPNAGMATMLEVRNAIVDFKKSKKPIINYSANDHQKVLKSERRSTGVLFHLPFLLFLEPSPIGCI